MTPRQRELARHALGLPNRYRRSYRNRFLAGGLCEDWRAMEAAGLAESDETDKLGRTWFWLTRAGAEAALDKGERLCPEDFPPLPRLWSVSVHGFGGGPYDPVALALTPGAARYMAFKALRDAGYFRGRDGFHRFLCEVSVRLANSVEMIHAPRLGRGA